MQPPGGEGTQLPQSRGISNRCPPPDGPIVHHYTICRTGEEGGWGGPPYPPTPPPSPAYGSGGGKSAPHPRLPSFPLLLVCSLGKVQELSRQPA
eukprot:303062-Pyramimonas_sp.AAC.1